MIVSHSKKAAAIAVAMVSLAGLAPAQLSLTAPGTPAVIDFTGFTGTGFSPTPTAGQLSSNTFRVNGDSASFAFGGTATTGIFAQGAGTPGNALVGIYAATIDGSTSLGVGPSAASFTPGQIVVRLQNNTGTTLNRIDVSYKAMAFNDTARSQTWNFAHSADDTTYTTEASLLYASPGAATSTADVTRRYLSITGLTVAPGAYYYIRFTTDDNGGTGNREEMYLDDISVTGHTNNHVVPANFLGAAPTLDGQNLTTKYGANTALQTVDTQFGNNSNELNGLFMANTATDLYVGLSGNSTSGNMVWMLFDSNSGTGDANLSDGTFSGYTEFEQVGTTGGALAAPSGFDVEYGFYLKRSDNSMGRGNYISNNATFLGSGLSYSGGYGAALNMGNTAGVGSWTAGPPAGSLQGNPSGINTGHEFRIPLSGIGSPAPGTQIRFLAFVTNDSGPGFFSNQFIPGLPLQAGNLGNNPANLGVRYVTYTVGGPPEVAVSETSFGNIDDGISDVSFGTHGYNSGNVTLTFTVSNPGFSNLTTVTPVISGAGFSAGADPLNGIIAAGGSDTFTVVMSTATAGPKTGTVSFGNNDGDENPFNFTISGNVLTAPTLVVTETGFGTIANSGGPYDFGVGTVGGSNVGRVFTVQNTGGTTMTTSLLSTVGPDFAVGGDTLAATIAPGGSDTFSIEMLVSSAGPKNDIVSFSNNDPVNSLFAFFVGGSVVTGPAVAVSETGFGAVTDGVSDVGFGTHDFNSGNVTLTFTVTNAGGTNLTTSNFAVTGTGFSAGADPLAATIASGGGTDTFTVVMSTAAAGPLSGSVSFDNNTAGATNPYTFSISGTVRTPATASVTETGLGAISDGGSASFGSVALGAPAVSLVFTVTNGGQSALNTSNFSLTGAGFTVTEALSATIAGGASDTFTVEMATAVGGAKSGNVSFDTNAGDGNYSFALTGTVTNPEIEVTIESTPVADGGGFSVGSAAPGVGFLTATVVIANAGDTTLTIGAGGVTLAPTVGTWAMSGEPPALFTIAPSGSTSFTVTLDRNTTAGSKSATLTINSDDANEGVYDINLTGEITGSGITGWELND